MSDAKVLVAGIGNIFLGDDGFGVEVARRLAAEPFPASVRVVDFGIRGFDLAYALLDDYELTILVDAVPRGGQPGTVYVIEPDLDALGAVNRTEDAIETHSMDPVKVLRLVKAMGGSPRRVLLVGCEPHPMDEYEEGRIGLSEAVEASLDEAAAAVKRLVSEFLAGAETGERKQREQTTGGSSQ